jgi:uncharacterized SAM-binding protein YcdF (DUF218 family)
MMKRKMGGRETMTARQWWLVALSGILLLDTLILIALGKINLGTVLPGGLGLGGMIALWQRRLIVGLKQRSPVFRVAWRTGIIGLILWLVTLVVFVLWTLQLSATDDRSVEDARYVIVLGAGLQGTEPSPTLRARLDTALRLAEINQQAEVVVSGGQGMNEVVSEASAMATYLERQDLPASRILREGKSRSTWENLSFSARLLMERDWRPETPVCIVTSDFHVVRARSIAMRAGFANICMIPAPTPLWILPNSWLREYFAALSSWVMGEV